ncbi:hypothetical protein E2C01_048516 [Portunus trituberculatus]|uniref:Uncharacterized protein n=1 Tax=Portunus trituberculatus TaxID=210409 RepID=A0A5B7GBC4_PORTR|nr:hypothetical protein [Portunus trituberculatus]
MCCYLQACLPAKATATQVCSAPHHTACSALSLVSLNQGSFVVDTTCSLLDCKFRAPASSCCLLLCSLSLQHSVPCACLLLSFLRLHHHSSAKGFVFLHVDLISAALILAPTCQPHPAAHAWLRRPLSGPNHHNNVSFIKGSLACVPTLESSEISTVWLRLNSHSIAKFICPVHFSPNSSGNSKFFDYLTFKVEHILSLYPFA